jgi:hypothetical protein
MRSVGTALLDHATLQKPWELDGDPISVCHSEIQLGLAHTIPLRSTLIVADSFLPAYNLTVTFQPLAIPNAWLGAMKPH